MNVNLIFRVCAFLLLIVVVPVDGIAQHIDSALAKTNNLVSIHIVPAKGNPSSPQVKTIYRPHAELVSSNAVAESVSVDCIICIENSSEWPYEFGTPYSLSGYDCLEMDLMLDSGETVALKRRHPKYLSDKGELVRIRPHKKWEYPVSLDSRLWLMSTGLATNRILKIRPRFAFGAFVVNGKYYRTYEEIEKQQKKIRSWKERDGELIGEWVDFLGGGGEGLTPMVV